MCVRLPARPARANGAMTAFTNRRSGVDRYVAATARSYSAESAEQHAEERVTHGRLRECARVRDEIAPHERHERPERDVLGKREPESKPSRVRVRPLPHSVERDAEHRTVERVE